MLHHIGINVSDLKESREFYLAALKPLGYKIKMSFLDGEVLGFGAGFAPDFWLAGPNTHVMEGSDKRHNNKDSTGDSSTDGSQTKPRVKTGPMHIAFAAKNRAQVRKFYEAAIAAGGTCNGPPGLRPEYVSIYYGAFVLDPEGRNIEAVCIKPGFIAEEWGLLGWSAAVLVLAAAGGGLGTWMGWIPQVL
ncbi:hypothetical protein M413DRAFT_443344 [Hebeloma cylindrosporum]|uniref:VOC domain-containing protein n=1 Tax=Hebeloma cylindrosporum TaxID=76867 RepID=A0A0C3C641_HEBCY|nr:hypothetical protein M413DRAFT_443344 [Hebeloma cylindrosporum h7]